MNKDKIFGYISFISGIATILDLMKKYLFTNKTTSFSLNASSGLEIALVIFLMMLSVYFLHKERKNNNFLLIAGYLYASISFVIYIVTAYQYTWGNKDITNFSLEVFIVFLTSFIATIIIFFKLKNNKNFSNYSYLFVTGLFIVIGMLLFKMIILQDSEMNIWQVMLYMIGGTLLFTFLSFLGKDITPEKSVEKEELVIKKTIGDDTRW